MGEAERLTCCRAVLLTGVIDRAIDGGPFTSTFAFSISWRAVREPFPIAILDSVSESRIPTPAVTIPPIAVISVAVVGQATPLIGQILSKGRGHFLMIRTYLARQVV